MFQKKMLVYFQSRLKNVRYNYVLALEKNDPDGIHDLRVEMKRVKAYFNLVESINDAFTAEKNFRIFRKIARSASGIRDTQVQQKLLEEIKNSLNLPYDDYEKYLKKKESESREIFINYSQKQPVKKLKESSRVISKTLKPIKPVWAETKVQGRFYNLKNNLIFLCRERKLRDAILHKVRILSKETHYTLDIIHKCFPHVEDGEDLIEKIKKVHQVLGKWHDYDVALGYLRAFRQDSGRGTNKDFNRELSKHIHDQKKILSKNFRTVFNEFKQTAELF